MDLYRGRSSIRYPYERFFSATKLGLCGDKPVSVILAQRNDIVTNECGASMVLRRLWAKMFNLAPIVCPPFNRRLDAENAESSRSKKNYSEDKKAKGRSQIQHFEYE